MSSSVISAPPAAKPRPTLARLLRYDSAATLREGLWGIAFAAPWLLGLLVFVLGPILVSMYLSFTKYDVISQPTWLGPANYGSVPVPYNTRRGEFWDLINNEWQAMRDGDKPFDQAAIDKLTKDLQAIMDKPLP